MIILGQLYSGQIKQNLTKYIEMNKAEIEYRKASAEALAKDITEGFAILGQYHPSVAYWAPSTDANQMEMIWELMKNNMTGTAILYKMIKKWLYAPGSDIKLATMKAFMEWQRKEEG